MRKGQIRGRLAACTRALGCAPIGSRCRACAFKLEMRTTIAFALTHCNKINALSARLSRNIVSFVTKEEQQRIQFVLH